LGRATEWRDNLFELGHVDARRLHGHALESNSFLAVKIEIV
jgi:hypothetical protein